MVYSAGDQISFTFGDVPGEINGTQIEVKATLTQTATGVQVQLQTLAGYNADLYGFFFNIADDNLLGHLVVSDGAVPLTLEQDGEVGTSSTNTVLAQSNNLNPATPLEVGVQFGSAGQSGGGFPSVTFNIATDNGALFTLDQLVNQQVGLRAQSAGTTNDAGSSKGTDTVPNPGYLEVIKYLDLNGDHVLSDAEKAATLTGYTFKLTDTTTQTVVATITDGQNGDALDGKVTFGNLAVGHSYLVEEVLSADQTAAGWYQTVGNDTSFTIDVSGEKETALFGNTQKGSLEVIKYNDLNGDHALSAGETATPLSGFTFKLFDTTGGGKALVGSLTDGTNGDAADGKVTFGNLLVGHSYSVEEDLSVGPAGWTQTVGNNTSFTIDVSGEKETAIFGNHMNEHGTAQTPGFWKNWPAKFNQETADEFKDAGLSNLKIDTKGGYETYFGVNALSTKSVSFLDALGANGGGENAFLRATAAAFANAATNEINYQIDEAQITAFATASGGNATAWLNTLYAIDGINGPADDHIDVAEIKALVLDVYTAGGSYSSADWTSLASALDAMNNMKHLDSSQIIA